MLCSVCNKNVAVIFINKVDKGQSSLEGLCYNCAKQRGINPLEVLSKQANLSEENLDDMSKQFEEMFKDISNNISPEEINQIASTESGNIPIGSIISNMFSSQPQASENKNEDE